MHRLSICHSGWKTREIKDGVHWKCTVLKVRVCVRARVRACVRARVAEIHNLELGVGLIQIKGKFL